MFADVKFVCDQQSKNQANQNQNIPCIDDTNDDDKGNDDDNDRETYKHIR